MVTDKALAATLLEEAHAALVEAGVVPERRARFDVFIFIDV
jgi:hypothetical protein